MDVKAATRVSGRSVFDRVRGGPYVKNVVDLVVCKPYVKNEVVCKYWLAGICNRNLCKFLHPERYAAPKPKQLKPFAPQSTKQFIPSAPHPTKQLKPLVPQPKQSKMAWRNPNYHTPKVSQGAQPMVSETAEAGFEAKSNHKETQPKVSECQEAGFEPTSNHKETQPKVSDSQGPEFEANANHKSKQQLCKNWVTGDCALGDNCQNLHSWSYGDGFTMLAKLDGHTKAVTGIALPSGSDKLYSVSIDKSMRVWDCHTGQCVGNINFDSECGTVISEGPCVLVGFPSSVKAWNIEAQSELTLTGPVGQVHAMVVGKDMVFAGLQDGTILAWKSNSPEVPTVLRGHSGAVLSIIVGAKNRLYSGSVDKTIKVWDLDMMQCLETLHGHSSTVTSVLCWDSFLLSASLDRQIKVWAATENGNLEVVYEHDEEHGVLALCGIHDAEGNPILLCSCDDNSVRLYDLPSFTGRGRIFTKKEVRSLQIGPGGLFFTGDATGQLIVWKLNGTTASALVAQ